MKNDHKRKRIVATIEARMTSTRLPGKVLLSACRKPLLAHLVERLQRVPSLTAIVVATTVNGTDDPVMELCNKLGVGCFRGSEEDVLGRVLGAAQANKADVIVEITGDCPAIDPEIVQHCIDEYFATGADYVSTRNYVGGMNTQVFSAQALAEVERVTLDDPAAREHVSLAIYEHPDIYKLHYVDAPSHLKRPDVAIELDTSQDYDMIKIIFDSLYPQNPRFNIEDILKFIDANPHILTINKDIPRKSAR